MDFMDFFIKILILVIIVVSAICSLIYLSLSEDYDSQLTLLKNKIIMIEKKNIEQDFILKKILGVDYEEKIKEVERKGI